MASQGAAAAPRMAAGWIRDSVAGVAFRQDGLAGLAYQNPLNSLSNILYWQGPSLAKGGFVCCAFSWNPFPGRLQVEMLFSGGWLR